MTDQTGPSAGRRSAAPIGPPNPGPVKSGEPEEGGGGGSETQTFVHRKRPHQIFPAVNFVFSRNGPFVLAGGAGGPPSSCCGVRPL